MSHRYLKYKSYFSSLKTGKTHKEKPSVQLTCYHEFPEVTVQWVNENSIGFRCLVQPNNKKILCSTIDGDVKHWLLLML